MKTHPLTALMLIPFLGLGQSASSLEPTQVAARAPQTIYDGWLVAHDSGVTEFPRTGKWKIYPGADNVTFASRGDEVIFYGSFVVYELNKAPLPVSAVDNARLSWAVSQGGETMVYAKYDGWDMQLNPRGIRLQRKKQTIWYYGSFSVDYRHR